MGGKNKAWGDFIIPSDIFDDAEWMTDGLIDSDTGNSCLLVYPPIASECPNCIFDLASQRSSNIYKAGGPIPFTNGTICPYCGGEGRSLLPSNETIKVRAYFDARSFVNVPPGFVGTAGQAQIIGYFTDVPKFNRATFLLLFSNLSQTLRQKYERSGPAIAYGFRGRYFTMLLNRIEGGV